MGDRSTGSARPEVNDGARGGGTRGDTGTARSPADGNGWRRFGEPSTRTSGSADTVPATPSGRSGGIRGEAYGGGAGREIDPSTRGGNANPNSGGNGWRRFGEPASPDAGSSRGSGEAIRGGREYGRGDTGRNDTRSSDTGSSDRTSGYGSPGDSVRGGRETYRQSPAVDSTNGTQPRNPDFPREGNTGGYRDRSGGGSRSDSIRVNPAVVRDRSDSGGYSGPSPSEGRGGFRGGGRESGARSGENGGGQYRSVPSYGGAAPNMGGGGGFGGMRGGGGNSGSSDTGGGMRGGGGSAPSGGNSGSSRGSEGGGTRNGGGRRSQ